jgi:hypothetical protein
MYLVKEDYGSTESVELRSCKGFDQNPQTFLLVGERFSPRQKLGERH